MCHNVFAKRHKHIVITTSDEHRDIRRHVELREDVVYSIVLSNKSVFELDNRDCLFLSMNLIMLKAIQTIFEIVKLISEKIFKLESFSVKSLSLLENIFVDLVCLDLRDSVDDIILKVIEAISIIARPCLIDY